mgnify:CR=1 FL=1
MGSCWAAWCHRPRPAPLHARLIQGTSYHLPRLHRPPSNPSPNLSLHAAPPPLWTRSSPSTRPWGTTTFRSSSPTSRSCRCPATAPRARAPRTSQPPRTPSTGATRECPTARHGWAPGCLPLAERPRALAERPRPQRKGHNRDKPAGAGECVMPPPLASMHLDHFPFLLLVLPTPPAMPAPSPPQWLRPAIPSPWRC